MTETAKNLRLAFQARAVDLFVEWRCDHKGVATGWCRIDGPSLLLPVAEAMAASGGRLSMITASLHGKGKRMREVLYHFDLDGATVTVTVSLPLEDAELPSITRLFRSADWHERELMELYDIAVVSHPDPRPLFIDRSAGKHVFERLVPYSSFTNGATTKELWERVLAAQSAKEKP